MTNSSALSLIIFSLLCLRAQARTWTNSNGKKIEAEFVRYTGEDKVVIKTTRKEFTLALTTLSEADQLWLKQQQEKNAAQLKETVGRFEKMPIDTRLFDSPKDYFKDSDRKKVLKGLDIPYYQKDENRGTMEQWLTRDLEKDTCTLYVPASYDGTEAYGLYLNIDSGKKAVIHKQWQTLFDKLKIIAVSADNADNTQPFMRRVCLSMDAFAMVENKYNIDPQRRVVGGVSGGGHMAMLTAAMFPKEFKGAISSAAQSYLPGHYPGLTIKDFKRSYRKKLKLVVVSGDKDYNYQEILDTSKVWGENNFQNYRFIDVPGMGHTYPTVDRLQEALEWIGL